MKLVTLPRALVATLLGLAVGFALGWKPSRSEAVASDAAPGQNVRTVPVEAGDPGSKSAASPTEPSDAPRIRAEESKSEALSPKKQFVRRAFERWTKEQRHHLLWEVFVRTPAAQRRLFDHLMASSDPAAWEAGQDYLIGTLDKDLARNIAEAYEKETNPGRRAMLAYALAANANHPATHSSLHHALEASDEALLKRTLTRLSLGGLRDHPDAHQRVEARLAAIVGSGMGEDVRVAAIRSLRGGESESNVRLLLDLILRDSSATIQKAALDSLPITYRSTPPFLKEQLDMFRTLLRDTARDPRLRRAAAERLRDQSRFNRMPLGEADRAIIDSLLEKKE